MPTYDGPGAVVRAEAADRVTADAHPISTIEAAREYYRRGWAIVPVPVGQKAAVMPGWPECRAELTDLPRLFGTGASTNIGVILGPRSGELVDVDLDRTEALSLAALHLPGTAAIFGRTAKPMSHRLYIALGAGYEAFSDPLSGAMLIELRA
jgi:hypothetical protein